jgi:hypothetical protein
VAKATPPIRWAFLEPLHPIEDIGNRQTESGALQPVYPLLELSQAVDWSKVLDREVAIPTQGLTIAKGEVRRGEDLRKWRRRSCAFDHQGTLERGGEPGLARGIGFASFPEIHMFVIQFLE